MIDEMSNERRFTNPYRQNFRVEIWEVEPRRRWQWSDTFSFAKWELVWPAAVLVAILSEACS